MTGARKTQRAGRELSRKTMIAVGLVVFIAVDVLLVALALGWDREPAPVGGSTSLTTQSSESESHSERTAPAEDPPSDSEVEPPRVAPRLISVVSDTVAWRSEWGVCDERGTLELTVDGGETWGAAYPSADGLGLPLWLSGADYTAAQTAVASGSDCEEIGIRTYDSGSSWIQDEQVVANSVFVDPSDPSTVMWGGDALEGPCEDIRQVAVTGGVAAVICEDGSLWSVPMGSLEWTRRGSMARSL